jgi:DNA primase
MARDRTIASAYSIRATAQARVSAPLMWEELDDARPDDFDITTMPARFKEVGDLHGPVHEHAYDIASLLEMYERDGEGDLAYPPDYPKMPGEPMRVQPSRARADPE